MTPKTGSREGGWKVGLQMQQQWSLQASGPLHLVMCTVLFPLTSLTPRSLSPVHHQVPHQPGIPVNLVATHAEDEVALKAEVPAWESARGH